MGIQSAINQGLGIAALVSRDIRSATDKREKQEAKATAEVEKADKKLDNDLSSNEIYNSLPENVRKKVKEAAASGQDHVTLSPNAAADTAGISMANKVVSKTDMKSRFETKREIAELSQRGIISKTQARRATWRAEHQEVRDGNN